MSISRIVDVWTRDLDFWRVDDPPEFALPCGLCAEFFLVDAVDLPAWTPHDLQHQLLLAFDVMLQRYFEVNWREPPKPIVDPLLWPLEFRDIFIDGAASGQLEIEEIFFKDVRRYSVRIADALDRIVWPRVATVLLT